MLESDSSVASERVVLSSLLDVLVFDSVSATVASSEIPVPDSVSKPADTSVARAYSGVSNTIHTAKMNANTFLFIRT